MGYFEQMGFMGTLSMMDTQPFVTKRVREFLFEGYDDMLLSMASFSGQDTCGKPMDKFGWFYKVGNRYSQVIRNKQVIISRYFSAQWDNVGRRNLQHLHG